jgi:hypothetical protein
MPTFDCADMGSSGAGPLLRELAHNEFESHVGAKLSNGTNVQRWKGVIWRIREQNTGIAA